MDIIWSRTRWFIFCPNVQQSSGSTKKGELPKAGKIKDIKIFALTAGTNSTLFIEFENIGHAPVLARFRGNVTIDRETTRLEGGSMLVGTGETVNLSATFVPWKEGELKIAGFVDYDGVSTRPITAAALVLASPGFSAANFFDITKNIIPSSKKLLRTGFLFYPIGRIMQLLLIRNSRQNANILSAIYQNATLRRGLWKYGIVVAKRGSKKAARPKSAV